MLHRAARSSPLLAPVLLAALACGSSSKLDDGGGSGDDSGGSADDTGVPQSCGAADTELIGGGPPGPLGFPPPCSPISDPGVGDYRCCSDDPAAADGAPPDYEGKAIPNGQPPYFSGNDNDLSHFGMCVRVTDLVGSGLNEAAALHCPVPCNPTWDSSLIANVCGSGRQCCQTVELQPEDCVMDPNTGLWRPVTAEDISVLTTWAPDDHATHQDPNGSGCLMHAGGDSNSPEFLSCVMSLSVANQRGFCMALSDGQSCPHEAPDYIDACEALNGG